jgi:hypothetical protein
MLRFIKYFLLALLILAPLAMPSPAPAQIAVGVSIRIGPPVLPVYAQPVCPGVGYIWTPGYWAYGDAGYFWVPGTWVLAPTPGYLWTPGYWGWGGGVYVFHAGYWGPHVGFYGGINYGFGYGGVGFVGGEWRGGVYHYNTAVTNVNTTIIHNTYNTTVINNNTTVNRISFNGGAGGTIAQPTAAERAAEREHHLDPTPMQQQHFHAASTNRAFLASQNHGQPSVAATARPGVFSGQGVVAAHSVNANPNHPMNTSATTHASMQNDRPPDARTTGTTNNFNSTSTNTNRPNNVPSNTTNTNRPPTTTTTHPNTTQPTYNNTSKPPQQRPNNKPPSEPHHEGGHESGHEGGHPGAAR